MAKIRILFLPFFGIDNRHVNGGKHAKGDVEGNDHVNDEEQSPGFRGSGSFHSFIFWFRWLFRWLLNQSRAGGSNLSCSGIG